MKDMEVVGLNELEELILPRKRDWKLRVGNIYGIRTRWYTLPFIYFIDSQIFITFTYYKSEITYLIYSNLLSIYVDLHWLSKIVKIC